MLANPGGQTPARVHADMGTIDLFWHLLNFLMPAAGVAAWAVALLALRRRQYRGVGAALAAFGIQFATGAAVLLAGLLLLGQDGRMLTYGALVLTTGSLLAWQWRRG